MDEAELCQRVGFINGGRLVALDSLSELKRSQMRGQVLEINAFDPERAVRILKAAQENNQIPFDEVALYGAQIHAVVPDAQKYKDIIQSLLTEGNIRVNSIEWIAPTLEDVFISSVKGSASED
jgi:ABC-2 type transport system ATP-binding protein